MTITAEALRTLHRLHQQATDLRGRLARGPKQIKARENNVGHLEGELETAKESQKKIKLQVSERELTLKEREGRILDIKAKLNTCSSNREYQAFVEQIAADEQANSVLSDEILELFDKVTESGEFVKQAEDALGQSKAQLKEVSDRVTQEKSGLESELQRVEKELAESEKNLPADVKQDYDRVVRAHGEDALAPLDDENCGGCFQRITPQMLNELALGKMVFCKSCGRLLYVPEDTAVG